MVKRHFLILLTLLLMISCKESNRDDKLEKKEIEIKEITNIKEKKIVDEKLNKSIETFIDVDQLYPELTAVEKKDSNLDLDESIEQFIILIDNLNLVTILVADFNKITREYFVAWEVRLPFIYNSDFSMSEQDILAYKHNMELVVSGTTIANNNALYIFRKSAPPKGIHIYYKTIFSYETTGTIELITPNRSLDYNESRKESDIPYSVAVEQTNIINENTIAITKENWVWDKRRNIFFRESAETTEQKINVKEKLRNVYYGNKNNFLKFINGEWLSKGLDPQENRIIIIDSKNDKVLFKYKDGVEEYYIYSFYQSFKKLIINLRNSDVSTIPYKLYFTLDSTDSFTITPPSNTSTLWDGSYNRINNVIKSSLISDTNIDIKKEIPFTGIYKNVAYTLNFSYPDYTKTDSITGAIEEGTFELLKLEDDQLILQLRAKSSLRSVYNVKNYQLWYSEQKLESQAIRTIKIHEGVLTTHGIEIKSDVNPIKFEQTEVISNE
ncbi:pallilysin-related adhesin [Thiospirochaeta perfilievii]|uniref:Pallilysin-related adhesin n=1 Tax=Thiospirochaeta perfilievii TaxID=252967 RepID=A0A5C1QDL9_9SPIO|nr:pallilysin-related adhesin [Thiospirochaeta perfilievii]QEN06175.1 pallilysin-related adhesin [Thiospirochaeta perfilievii]